MDHEISSTATAPPPKVSPSEQNKTGTTVDTVADHSIELNDAQLSVVGTLVLTQSAVGIFILHALLKGTALTTFLSANQFMVSAGLLSCFAALALSLFNAANHRQLPGRRWRMRTLTFFTVFLGSATSYSLLLWGQAADWAWATPLLRSPLEEALLLATVLSGTLGVFSSTMVCASTRRPTWAPHIAGTKFAFTTLLLGLAVTQLALTSTGNAEQLALTLPALMLCAVAKGSAEYHFLKGRKARRTLQLRRVVRLLTHHLGWMTRTRFILALACGIILPCAALIWGCCTWIAWAVLIGLLTEELFERYQFFACTCTASRSTAYATIR